MAESRKAAAHPAAFLHSRLRGYASKLEHGFDAGMSTSSSMALAAVTSPLRGTTGRGVKLFHNASEEQQQDAFLRASAQFANIDVSHTNVHGSPVDVSAAFAELASLRAEVAGVESVLGFMKGSDGVTTMGRRATRLNASQELLRQRGGSGAAAAASPKATKNMQHGPKSTVFLGDTASMGSPGGGISPARCDSPSKLPADSGTFDALTQEDSSTRGGGGARAWRPIKGPVPVGRGEAVILEAALDEMLPAGAITAKYAHLAPRAALIATAAAAGLDGQSMTPDRHSAPEVLMGAATLAERFLAGQDITRDFEMLEMVLKEVARQVASYCVERARVLEKIGGRYREVFGSMQAASSTVNFANESLATQLSEALLLGRSRADRIAQLEAEVVALSAKLEAECETSTKLRVEMENVRWDADQQSAALMSQNDILAAEVQLYEARLAAALIDKDVALANGLARLEADLESVSDERDDLSQRIRFLERQLRKQREGNDKRPIVQSSFAQTDPVDWAMPANLDDNGNDDDLKAAVLAPVMEVSFGGEMKGLRRRKRPSRQLGAFAGLIHTDRVGRVKGLPWAVGILSQIYFDKVINDTVADREGNARLTLAQFVYDWHINRFGLRNLAEANLLDLIATSRHHYKASTRIRWFARFAGLVEVGEPVNTTQHVSHYLFVLQQLAYPAAVTALFPEVDDTPLLLKYAMAVEAIKAVFRYLNEPDAVHQFIAKGLDNIVTWQDEPPVPVVDADDLIQLLMEEFHKRIQRNMGHLSALFRAADFDGDGWLNAEEFAAAVRQLSADAQDKLVSKMFAAAVKVKAEDFLVGCDAFVATARNFGFDRWHIEDIASGTLSADHSPEPAATAVNSNGVNTSTGAVILAATSAGPTLLQQLSGISGSGGLQVPDASSNQTQADLVPPAVPFAAGGASHRINGSGSGVGCSHGPMEVERIGSRPSSSARGGGTSRSTQGATGGGEEPINAAQSFGDGPAPCGAEEGSSSARAGGAGGFATSRSDTSSVQKQQSGRVSPGDNFRRRDGTAAVLGGDRALLRLLDSALETMDPPLEEQTAAVLRQVQQASHVGPQSTLPEGWAQLPLQLQHFQEVYAARNDAPVAWLAFRLLLAAIASISTSLRNRAHTAMHLVASSAAGGSAGRATTAGKTRSAAGVLLAPGWKSTTTAPPRPLPTSGLQSSAPPPLNPQVMPTDVHHHEAASLLGGGHNPLLSGAGTAIGATPATAAALLQALHSNGLVPGTGLTALGHGHGLLLPSGGLSAQNSGASLGSNANSDSGFGRSGFRSRPVSGGGSLTPLAASSHHHHVSNPLHPHPHSHSRLGASAAGVEFSPAASAAHTGHIHSQLQPLVHPAAVTVSPAAPAAQAPLQPAIQAATVPAGGQALSTAALLAAVASASQKQQQAAAMAAAAAGAAASAAVPVTRRGHSAAKSGTLGVQFNV